MEDELNVLTNGRHKNGIPTLLNTCIGLVHKDGLYQVLHNNNILGKKPAFSIGIAIQYLWYSSSVLYRKIY